MLPQLRAHSQTSASRYSGAFVGGRRALENFVDTRAEGKKPCIGKCVWLPWL